MARQTTMSNGTSPINGVIEGIGGLGTNVVSLAALQARLAAVDFQEMMGRAAPAAVSIGILIPLGFASLTTLLVSLGYWLSAEFQLSIQAALGIVGTLGLVLTACLAGFAWFRFNHSFTSFRRSKEELERNVAWLGTVLKQSGR